MAEKCQKQIFLLKKKKAKKNCQNQNFYLQKAEKYQKQNFYIKKNGRSKFLPIKWQKNVTSKFFS